MAWADDPPTDPTRYPRFLDRGPDEIWERSPFNRHEDRDGDEDWDDDEDEEGDE